MGGAEGGGGEGGRVGHRLDWGILACFLFVCSFNISQWGWWAGSRFSESGVRERSGRRHT